MNPYHTLIPNLLAALVIVVIARRAVWQSRRDSKEYKEYIAKQQMELQRYLSQVEEAIAHPSEPACKFISEWQRTAD
jgi:hypothetical protein